MNKIYIKPALFLEKIDAGTFMNSISNPTKVEGADGLTISNDDYEDEGRAKYRNNGAWNSLW